ncbi:MAG: hypothetical protein O7D96_03745, partial [SAR324 cluster bacterium]|nr:hypothetical protein [SAR324 cluster bacterium]
ETIDALLPALTHENHGLAVQIAAIPDEIRGYEAIKERMIGEAETKLAELQQAYRDPRTSKLAG